MSLHDLQIKFANALHRDAIKMRAAANAITLDALKGKAKREKEAACIAEGVAYEAAALARAAQFRAAKSQADLANFQPK